MFNFGPDERPLEQGGGFSVKSNYPGGRSNGRQEIA